MVQSTVESFLCIKKILAHERGSSFLNFLFLPFRNDSLLLQPTPLLNTFDYIVACTIINTENGYLEAFVVGLQTVNPKGMKL